MRSKQRVDEQGVKIPMHDWYALVVASHSPTVIVIGGPNGAGKSTIAPAIIERAFGQIEFVNADTIARGLSALNPDRQAFAAGRIMLRHIAELATARRNFAFETTLASRTFAPFLRRLISNGYRSHLVYVWVRSPEIAVRRVRSRIASGGHSVPEETIRRRYVRSIHNLFHLYLPLARAWEAIDNSSPGLPTIIAAGGMDEDMIVYDKIAWRELERFRNEP
jgi:predicted ABC-type ATPase